MTMPSLERKNQPVVAPSDKMDDHSSTFHTLRAKLIDDKGRRYLDLVRALRPNYARVCRDIALGYGMLTASCFLTVWLPFQGAASMLTIVVGSVLIGYWIAYLQLFIHEGAHFNLAPHRTTNERVCDGLIGWMIGTSVKRYRVVHFQHHRALGSVDDSEISYFFPLNLMFVFNTTFGVRALKVFLARARYVGNVDRRNENAQRMDRLLFAGVAAHACIIAVMLLIGGWPSAVAWIVGVGMVFPFLGGLRQILEHRDIDANPAVNYNLSNHGAFTRLFGNDPISATFGGAGFTRHLLHHWEPQVSYTNLPELEGILLETEMRPIIESRRSTYAATFLKLFSLY